MSNRGELDLVNGNKQKLDFEIALMQLSVRAYNILEDQGLNNYNSFINRVIYNSPRN